MSMLVRLPATVIVVVALAVLFVRHQRTVANRHVAELCGRWQRAVGEIERLPPHTWGPDSVVLEDALSRPEMEFLWSAQAWLARHPLAARNLVPDLAKPMYVGLTDSADVIVEGREMPDYGHGYFTTDDLFTRAGRAAWLLHEATGHDEAPHAVVGTNRIVLADIAKEWQAWFDDLDGGQACFGVQPL
jgi:hypothetical protein